MLDISELSKSEKDEIADYIRQDNLAYVNTLVKDVKVNSTFYTRYVKRALDIVLSLAAIGITLPINAVIGIVTYFDVGMPIFFTQQRTGKDRVPFNIYKFRNMTNDTDAKGELLPPEQRVTKWGKFVRKTSLDELLNFISILNGSMSFIGPRPLPEYYTERLNNRHAMIYAVKPGLECPTPKKMDHSLSWEERFDNYVWYVENVSFPVDMKLSLRLVEMAVADRSSKKKRSEAKHGGFLGYDREGHVIYTKAVPEKYVEKFCEAHGYKDLQEAVEDRSRHKAE